MKLFRNSHTGFSFIEVLVAVFISSIGLLGLAALQLKSLKIESTSLGRSQATYIVESIANHIYLAEEDPTLFVTSSMGIQCSSFQSPDQLCSDTDPDSTAEECSLSDNAKYAIWDNLCKGQKETDVLSSGSNDLIDPVLTISCEGGFDLALCQNSPTIELELSWKNLSRSAKQAQSGKNKPVTEAERLFYRLEVHP